MPTASIETCKVFFASPRMFRLLADSALDQLTDPARHTYNHD
jgi:hypothetical protein